MSTEPQQTTPDLASRLAAALKDEYDIGQTERGFMDEPGGFDFVGLEELTAFIRKVIANAE